MKTSFKLKPLSNTTVPAKKFIPTFVPYIKGHNEGFPELSLLQAEQPQFFQRFLIDKISHSSDHFCDPLLDLFHQVHALLVLKNPELDAVCQVGLTTVEYRGKIPFLELWITLLMQPRLQLSFRAMSSYYQLSSNFSSTNTPKSSAGLFSISLSQACIDSGSCPIFILAFLWS